MKLITEELIDVEFISEGAGDKKRMFIEGIFMQSVPNKNGRLYPEHILFKESMRYMKEEVENNRAVGELGHPQGPTINLDRISHKIESLRCEGKNVYGKAKLTESTPMGKIAVGLINDGVQLGVSSRGLGSLKENRQGIKEVQEDFKLVTAADIVQNPSGPDCWVGGIMENVDWVLDPVHGWKALEHVHESRKNIHKMNKRELEEAKVRLFEHFLNNIKYK